MKANATFQPKNRNQSRSVSALLAAPLLIAILALAAVALASHAAPVLAQSNTDATLSDLSISAGTVNGFTAILTSYEVGVDSNFSRTTVYATPTQSAAEVVITPADSSSLTGGHQVNLSPGKNTVTFTVTASNDSTTKVYTVNINRAVINDYGWKADDDFDTLIAAGDTNPFNIWSNGTTLWLIDIVGLNIGVNAYNLATKARQSSQDIPTSVLRTAGNESPRGIWSDGITIWIGDRTDNKIYAYNLVTKNHDATKDFGTLDTANTELAGLWSDGTTMWVLDNNDDKIYAYSMATKARDTGKDFNTLSAANNNNPNGLWSDGTTMWVSDSDDDKLYAYNINTKARDSAKDFTTLNGAGNAAPAGIWSDDQKMWVVDADDNKIYAYNMPSNIPPTGADSSVSTPLNTAYTLDAGDFTFADADTGDTLQNIRIMERPTVGTLALNGAPVSVGQEISKTSIDNDELVFTPETNGSGLPYSSFRFKVNDGEDDSRIPYRIDITIIDPSLNGETGPYGDPIRAVIGVNSGWQPFTLASRVADEWFRVTLEDNKNYFIRINTMPNTKRPRLGAAYDAYTSQHTAGSGADCQRTEQGTSCAGHSWFEINLATETHSPGSYYFHVNAPHSIPGDPGGSIPPGENPYEYSVMVEGPTEGDGLGRSAPPSPLRAFFNSEPDDHNGSDPFTLELAFDDSIRGDGDDMDAAITVTNGSLTSITQNQWEIQKWDLTVTPSAAADITIDLAASVPCDEDGALCTISGRRLKRAVQTAIDYTPPPPTISSVSLVSAADDNDAWDVDELVTADVTFTAPVFIQGRPTLGISVTGTRHEAAYASGDTTSTLRFSYPITSSEAGAISAGLISDGFNTATGTIFDTHAQLAVLDFDVDESATLTGQFQNVPENHVGNSKRFTFTIQFSLDPDLSASDIKDDLFTVTNGDVKRVQRTNREGPNRNSRWLVKVKPTGEDDVTITLPVTTNCSYPGAVCTNDGTKFSEQISITVPRTAPVVANSAATGAPTISGTVQVGETLTAGTSGISDADGLTSVAYTYQWLADDVAISGATNSTYTLAATDQAKAIKVTVSFTDDADNSESLTSAATSAVAAAPNNQAAGQPTITGTTTTGSTLTAVTSGITDADGMSSAVFSYQWLRADAAISGATSSTYVLVSADEGNTIKVTVSFTDNAGNAESLTSTGTAATAATPTNSAATGQPTISGSTPVGSVLTASTSGISDANGLESASFTYQWLRSDAEITDATGSAYTVVLADEGETIKVRVSFTDDDGFSESRTSDGLYIPVVALEGFFDATTVPDHHNGANTAFTFELYFSVEPSLGFEDVRDKVLAVTNGSITRAVRTNPQSDDRNSRWTITVQPGGNSAVTIAFSPTTDCTADSAVCTTNGKTLSNSGSITVAGP